VIWRNVIIATFLMGTAVCQDCEKKPSNAETRQCYAAQQTKVNAESDVLVKQIAADFRSSAREIDWHGSVAKDELIKAAKTLEQSHQTWKAYRDGHCKAVSHSWTTGSGAGTAYERCMYEIGTSRLRQLRSDFNIKK
jgi:uncharacterized protein YecT (DUF1311 family)